MSFPSNPNIGDTYEHPDLGSTYIWYGEATGWQRSITSAVMDYSPRDLTLDEVRTDVGFPVITRNDAGEVVRVTREGLDTIITYNNDGTLDTQTFVTASKTVTRKAVYDSKGFLKFIPA